MEQLRQFWHSLTQKSRLLVIGLVAGICIFLHSGFSSAGIYWYDGEAFTAGSFFLPDKYQYNFFGEEDMNTAYNWMYGDEHEELKFLNEELAKA
ncbi:hypothetical protein ABID29_001549 [Streptococcus rupicaprae]|uniref:Uncharacterized protein n=1 Tax=Streptococcus rupicaprae TaxID=759619 RepID=A0ABV2FIP7_9STRE